MVKLVVLHTELGLNIKVKTIDGGVLVTVIKGTGAVPGRIVRAESSIEELGKVLARLLGSDVVVAVGWVKVTADAEQDLDTTLLAVRNTLLDRAAVDQKVRFNIILSNSTSGPTVAGKVGARVTRFGVLRGLVDECQSDILDATVTVVLESFVSDLTLKGVG